jgi:hypothetical protein
LEREDGRERRGVVAAILKPLREGQHCFNCARETNTPESKLAMMLLFKTVRVCPRAVDCPYHNAQLRKDSQRDRQACTTLRRRVRVRRGLV